MSVNKLVKGRLCSGDQEREGGKLDPALVDSRGRQRCQGGAAAAVAGQHGPAVNILVLGRAVPTVTRKVETPAVP